MQTFSPTEIPKRQQSEKLDVAINSCTCLEYESHASIPLVRHNFNCSAVNSSYFLTASTISPRYDLRLCGTSVVNYYYSEKYRNYVQYLQSRKWIGSSLRIFLYGETHFLANIVVQVNSGRIFSVLRNSSKKLKLLVMSDLVKELFVLWKSCCGIACFVVDRRRTCFLLYQSCLRLQCPLHQVAGLFQAEFY